MASAERAALARALLRVGPDADTLCEGWQAHDLVAHLVAREARPDLALGLVAAGIQAAQRHADQVQAQYRRRDFADLVAAFAAGPPLLSGFTLPGADAFVNAIEYVIHHEDVLRAQPDPEACQVPGEVHLRVWPQVCLMLRARLRRSPIGVLVQADEGRQLVAAAGMPRVILRAPMVDLVLLVSGRADHSHYRLDGLPGSVEVFQEWLGAADWAY